MALKISAAQMVAEARTQIPEVATEEAIAQLGDPDLVIVDIRDVRERQRTGCIPGSVHAPRGMIEFWVDPDSPYHKEVFAQAGKRYLFHCASGWRSALTVATLQEMGFEAAHLKDGFNDWVQAGGPVEPVAPKS
ncbi:rhodanese-like domain-containing protein [Salipiger abyssi]|uniref:rhodanese-like domain-containing protein n=1 Tax=Salipiger abyssi TaxID=1250539 RepID=UPI001A903F81|nr:rhodanese-like domain-containing protein [Salipiger abyssi]MBN9889403.1 rhodanese-like domain-containing protein [Salipiger abyssi]